ncbi:MAG: aminotransferase class V-fold PLP-dependent enzyme [Burkholderiaceae bacterium]
MFDSALLSAIRERFCHVDHCPFQGPRIFFENAGGALHLKSVVERSALLAAIPDNQGRDNPASHALVAMIEQGKRDMRLFMGASQGQVFIGESGTELLFRLVRNAAQAAPAGGRILGSTLEHPATASAGDQWARATGRPYVRIVHDDDTGTVTADAYRAQVTPDTRVATVIHTSPVSGMSVDVGAVVRAIRSVAPDCLVILDGIQHAAHGALDIDSYDIDGYAISPYKVFSRHGYGVAWASDRLTALPHERLNGSAPTQWDLGTRDTGAYATFSDVVDYLRWLGGQTEGAIDPREQVLAAGRAISAHEAALIALMRDGDASQRGLAAMTRVKVIGGWDNPSREGLAAITVDGMPSVAVVNRLRESGIRVHLRKADHFSGNILTPLGLDSCIRVSLAHYNSPDEVRRFLRVMDEMTA